MRISPKAACWALCCILTLPVVGCQMADVSTPEVQRPSVLDDPCATRLHDVCGTLLLYHSRHKRMPDTLDELAAIDATLPQPLTCPVSNEPYVYASRGLNTPGHPGSLVLYDAGASHSGMRWGILASNPQGAGPMTTRVVLLPEETVVEATRQAESQAGERD